MGRDNMRNVFVADICNRLDLWTQLPLCKRDVWFGQFRSLEGNKMFKVHKTMKGGVECHGCDHCFWACLDPGSLNLFKSLSQLSPVWIKTSARMEGCLWMIHHGGNFSPQPESVQRGHAKFKVTCTKDPQTASNNNLNWYIGSERETWSQLLQISLCCGITVKDKKDIATLRLVQYFVGEKQHRTSTALSLTQNTDVRAAQGLIRGSLVSACLHIAVFSGCVVIQNAYRDCGQNRKGLPVCLEVNAFNKVWKTVCSTQRPVIKFTSNQ